MSVAIYRLIFILDFSDDIKAGFRYLKIAENSEKFLLFLLILKESQKKWIERVLPKKKTKRNSRNR